MSEDGSINRKYSIVEDFRIQ